MPNTISLKGTPIRKEVVATGAVTPGHQVDIDGAVAAAGSERRAFALENDLVGDAIGTAYDIGDTIQVGVFPPGGEVYGFLAHGENVAAGAALEADGNGALIAQSSNEVVAYALEAVNNTSGDQARIKLEVA